jgi:hypothetical protein
VKTPPTVWLKSVNGRAAPTSLVRNEGAKVDWETTGAGTVFFSIYRFDQPRVPAAICKFDAARGTGTLLATLLEHLEPGGDYRLLLSSDERIHRTSTAPRARRQPVRLRHESTRAGARVNRRAFCRCSLPIRLVDLCEAEAADRTSKRHQRAARPDGHVIVPSGRFSTEEGAPLRFVKLIPALNCRRDPRRPPDKGRERRALGREHDARGGGSVPSAHAPGA